MNEAQNNTISAEESLPKRWWSVVLALLVVVGLGGARWFYLQHTHLDLAPDEAQYWVWSQNLAWGYYSKGPVVAWLISLSSQYFGDTLFGVRFFSVVGLSLLAFVSFLMARNWKGDRAGWYALLLVTCVPLIGAGGLLMTPDVPTLVLWSLALFILSARLSWLGQWGRFILIGLIIGAAGLAKYTAGAFYPLLGLYLLMDKERRQWLKKPHIYVAGLISLAVMSPLFYWNYQNDFIGLLHVLGQIKGEQAPFDPAKTFGNFFGSQFGVLGPFVFLLLLIYWARGPQATKDRKGELIWWFSLPLFAFFMLKSIDTKVQANWPVLALYGGLIGLSGWMALQPRWGRNLFLVSVLISAGITAVAHDTFMLRKIGIDLPVKKDPLKPVMGWRGLGHAASAYMASLPPGSAIMTTRYQTASELMFYTILPNGQRPPVLYVNPGYRRQNHFDYADWPENVAGRTFIYINEGLTLEKVVEEGFETCKPLGPVVATRDDVELRRAMFFKCEGYKGVERKKAEKY